MRKMLLAFGLSLILGYGCAWEKGRSGSGEQTDPETSTTANADVVQPSGSEEENPPADGMAGMKVPAGFNYDTSTMVSADFTVTDAHGNPAGRQFIRVYAPSADDKVDPRSMFFMGDTDQHGVLETPLRVPSYWEGVLVTVGPDGAATAISVPVSDGRVHALITLADW